MSADDRTFADALIKELHYLDTAKRWLNDLATARGAKPALLAEVDSLLIDIMQSEGKSKEALAALDAFKKKYPWHPRAALGALEQLGSVLARVLGQFEKATTEPDEKKSTTLLAKAKADFGAEIEKPLEALIADLNQQVEASKDKEGNEDPQKKRLHYQAELVQVNIYLVYARALKVDDKDRETILEKGLALADRFVDERYEFFIMQYKAQIQKGLYLTELGRHSRAADELSFLYDVEPPFRGGKLSGPLVKAFREIRLQALLFGARALNQGGKNRQAVDQLAPLMKASADPKDHLKPVIGVVERDPDLQKFAVLTRLEYGISLAGSGDVAGGMNAIHKVISKYEKLYKESKDPKFNAFIIDARKALGSVSSGGVVQLSGRDYYQAGIGLKSQRKLDQALTTFQKALGALSPQEVNEWAPACLNEVGEICYILGRFDESAMAFADLAIGFPSSQIFVTKANRSLAGAVSKWKNSLEAAGVDHAGVKVFDELVEQFGPKTTRYQAKMASAQTLEQNGEFTRAREMYFEIPLTDPDYGLRAHASAWSTLLREYEEATEIKNSKARKAAEGKLTKRFDEGIAALQDILSKALELEDDLSRKAAATAVLALAQMHYARDEFAQAAETLKLFVTDLADDKVFRCAGLGYLVLAMVKAGEGKHAAGYYLLLRKDCLDEAAVPSAAYALSDDATARGDLKSAAIYILHYAQHATTKSELKNLNLVMKVVQVLSDGGMINDARQYIEVAKSIGGTKDSLGRELLWMEAKIAKAAEDWDQVIELLGEGPNGYVGRYTVQAGYAEDPYVCRELGWATIKKGRRQNPKGTLPLDLCNDAKQYYGHTVFLLDSVMKKVAANPGEPVDETMVRDYWLAALRLMQVNSHLGRNDEDAGYNDIHKFVNENQQRLRKQGKLWPRFKKLWEEACGGLDRDINDYLPEEQGSRVLRQEGSRVVQRAGSRVLKEQGFREVRVGK